MIRRFNYTDRKRITHDRVEIRIKEPEGGGPVSFAGELSLNGLGLSLDAPVIIEAYRGRAADRFRWGSVGAPSPPHDCRLLNVPDNPLFRVKVSHPDGSGKLLAMADHIRPRVEGQRGSLIALKVARDLGKEVWRVDFGDGDDEPILHVNGAIQGIQQDVLRGRAFRALVMPEVLRAVLVNVLIVQEIDMGEDEGQWGPLLDFARSLHRPLDTDGDGPARMKWIDEVVRAFTQKSFKASDLYATVLGGR